MDIKGAVKNTIASTLVLMFSLALFAFNLVCALFPKGASDFFEWLSWGNLSVSLSREVYRREGDINALAVLVERAIKYQDYDAIARFVPLLQSSEHYGDFCEFKDCQGVTQFSSYRSYIEGNYLIALYNNGEGSKCLDLARKHATGSYDAQNPVRFLVRFLSSRGAIYTDLIDLLKAKYRQEGLSCEELKNICVDLFSMYINASDMENAEYWRAEYQKHKT
jgi:hypothetical protein